MTTMKTFWTNQILQLSQRKCPTQNSKATKTSTLTLLICMMSKLENKELMAKFILHIIWLSAEKELKSKKLYSKRKMKNKRSKNSYRSLKNLAQFINQLLNMKFIEVLLMKQQSKQTKKLSLNHLISNHPFLVVTKHKRYGNTFITITYPKK